MLSINLKKNWKDFELDVSFDILRGKITALFGPSGAGKSSILRLISGLEMAEDGFIKIIQGLTTIEEISRILKD